MRQCQEERRAGGGGGGRVRSGQGGSRWRPELTAGGDAAVQRNKADSRG